MEKNIKTEENYRVKKKRKSMKRRIFLIILIFCIILGIWFAKKVHSLNGNVLAALMGHDEETQKNLETIQVLLMGESTGMSDTLIVASYNPKTQNIAMLSIPRDTYVTNGNHKYSVYNKINSVYEGGETPEKTVAAVNEVTGLDLKYYMLVDTKALRKLVDTIGGVEFYVPTNMNYDDSEQDLHIHLKEGLQILDGSQAEQVVRFRHNNNGTSYSYEYGNEDYGRMKTQRALIVAVAKQSLKIKNITEIKNIINIMKEDVKTNIEFDLIKDYVPYAVNVNLESLRAERLPGKSDLRNGGWFFFHDEEETAKLVDEMFNEKIEEEEDTVVVTQ